MSYTFKSASVLCCERLNDIESLPGHLYVLTIVYYTLSDGQRHDKCKSSTPTIKTKVSSSLNERSMDTQ